MSKGCDVRCRLRTGPLGRIAPTKQLISAKRARERVAARGAPVTRLPKHVEPFANYMVQRSRAPVDARDIVKAYIITRSSVQRRSQRVPKVCAVFPEYRQISRLRRSEWVRPEDVMSALLLTTSGRQYLDAAARGQYDATAAKALADRMVCFGLVYPRAGSDLSNPATVKKTQGLFANDLRRAVRYGSKSAELNAMLAAPPETYWSYVEDTFYGVGPAKAGFFAAILGRGDIPTFDAREIALWRAQKKGKFDPGWRDVQRLKERFEDFGMVLAPEHEPFRAHLTHHALWDAMGAPPSKTTHGSMIRAMQFAGSRRRRRR